MNQDKLNFDLQLFADPEPNPNPEPNKDPEQKNEPETKSYTQDEINKIISERLKREKEKYSDYDDLKKFKSERATEEEKEKERIAQVLKENEDFKAKLAEIENTNKKKAIAQKLGLDESLIGRLQGADEAAWEADAQELIKIIGKKPVGNPSNPASGNETKSDEDMSMEEYAIKFRERHGLIK